MDGEGRLRRVMGKVWWPPEKNMCWLYSYFRPEMQLLLEKAGFTIEAVKGDFTDADVTADYDAIVYFARK